MADGNGSTMFALRERRNALAKEARNLVDQNPGAEWKPEHGKKFDELSDEIGRIDAEVSRRQKVLDMEAEKAFKDMGGQEFDTPEAGSQKAIAAAVNKWLRFGNDEMTEEDWGNAREIMNSSGKGGFEIRPIKNTMSGQPGNGTQGGYTVPTTIVAQVTEALK